jgi:hypothetical protein
VRAPPADGDDLAARGRDGPGQGLRAEGAALDEHGGGHARDRAGDGQDAEVLGHVGALGAGEARDLEAEDLSLGARAGDDDRDPLGQPVDDAARLRGHLGDGADVGGTGLGGVRQLVHGVPFGRRGLITIVCSGGRTRAAALLEPRTTTLRDEQHRDER